MPKKNEKEGAVRWVQNKVDRLSAALAAVLESECKEELEGVQPEVITGIRFAALNNVHRQVNSPIVALTITEGLGHPERAASSGPKPGKVTRRGRPKKREDKQKSTAGTGSDVSEGTEFADGQSIEIPGLTMSESKRQ
jgi:hypothetical protein